MFSKINKNNLLKFKSYQINNSKPSSVNARLIAINTYLDFINKPELKLKLIKNSTHTLSNIISIDEYNTLISKLKADNQQKVYFMVKFLACTGCRVSELINLTKDCLTSGECVLYCKGNKIRRIFIPQKLIEESREYFNSVSSNWLFPNKQNKQMSTNNVYKQLKFYANKYGINENLVHPHAFRHLFAIEFLKTSQDITLLKDILGHSNINTTAIYLKLNLAEQKKIFNDVITW